MVYDWSAHKETCYRLYIEEGRSLEEIMQYMKSVHDFTPSKRAYQTQFSRWKFPTKQNPAYKNPRLVERVKELWEKNVNSQEMLRVLNEEDGFSIKARELVRVRSKFRLLLRVPNGDKAQPREFEAPTTGDAAIDDGASASGVEADRLYVAAPSKPSHESSPATASVVHRATNSVSVSARKRRRMLAQAMDPSKLGARFPSEMTFDQARTILSLDATMYRALRSRFEEICSEEHVLKKTVAGPQQWDAVKQRLINELPHLQKALRSPHDDRGSATLALDILCTDVTKRMRMMETRMTLGQAKNILGLNPEESRVLRAALHQVLQEAHFTSKSGTTPQQWLDIKRKWGEKSDLVKGILSDVKNESHNQQKTRALELLARDVVKRLRDDKAPKKARHVPQRHSKRAETNCGRGDTENTPDNGQDDTTSENTPAGRAELGDHHDEDNAASDSEMSDGPDTHIGYGFPISPVAGQMSASLQSQALRGPDATAGLTPSARLFSSGMTPAMSMETHIGSSLLMTSNPQTPYINQSYIHQHFTPSSSSSQGYQTVISTSSSFAVYLRLHPSSSFVTSANLWITTLQSQSLQELRQAAVAPFPSALCVRVEGVLKDGKGGELPLPIEQDQELVAYLAHLQGAAPTFNVQLAWKTS